MKENELHLFQATQSERDRTRALLQTRAHDLARPPVCMHDDIKTIDIVEFRLAQERYAIEQQYVQEIHGLKEITPLPCTPPFMIGIVNLRGQFLPVIDIKKFFDLPDGGITDIHMVVVVRSEDIELGILADALVGTRAVPVDTIQCSLPTLAGIRTKYLKGITNEHVVILDAAKMLSDPKIMVNDEDVPLDSVQSEISQ